MAVGVSVVDRRSIQGVTTNLRRAGWIKMPNALGIGDPLYRDVFFSREDVCYVKVRRHGAAKALLGNKQGLRLIRSERLRSCQVVRQFAPPKANRQLCMR